jgi:hypothetical protein
VPLPQVALHPLNGDQSDQISDPGHVVLVEQLSNCTPAPEQYKPPYNGIGFVHVRYLI